MSQNPTNQSSAKGFDLVSYARMSYSKKDVAVIERAVALARQAHAGQFRKSGQEYIEHPLNVAKILVDWKMNLNSVMAEIGRAHVWTPVTRSSRMPSSAWKKKK